MNFNALPDLNWHLNINLWTVGIFQKYTGLNTPRMRYEIFCTNVFLIQGIRELSQQLGISSIGISKATRKRMEQLPALLGVVAFVLVVVCKQMQQFPTILGATVHRKRDKSHKTLESMCNARTWHQKCWESCANGSNIIALRFGDHGTEEMLGVVGSKSLTRFKFCATTRNNKQQHATGRCANGRNNNVGSCWLTMLRRFARGF